MSVAQAKIWAGNLTVAGMARKIHAMEIWIAELNETAVAWGAIHRDRLEGLYTAPEFAGHGIGTELLLMLEGLLRERDIPGVSAQASANAEAFYLRRGYTTVGPRTPQGAQPTTKRLS